MIKIKQILALLLALTMIVGLGISTMAADPDPDANSTTDANKGKITVVNYDDAQTYTAYKIFDVTYSDQTAGEPKPDAYSYTIASDSVWFTVVKAYADTTGKGLTLTAVSGTTDPITYVVTTDDNFSAADFAAALYPYADKKEDPADITDTGAVVLTDGEASNLELGYWFVTTTTGALCNLTTTNPEQEIYDKNIIVFEKTESDYTVEVGQTVTYILNGVVPSTTGYTKYTYKVEDTMSSGLTFNKDVKIVFDDGTTKTVIVGTANTDAGEVAYVPADNDNVAAPTVDYSTDNKFVVQFDMTKWQKYVNQDIVITYTALVNEDAITHDEENNTAKLTYSNNPNDDNSTDEITDDEHLYSFNIVIDKYAKQADATDTDEKLADAEFALYKEVSEEVPCVEGDDDYDADPERNGTKTVTGKFYYYYNASEKKVEWVAESALTDGTETPVDPSKATNITKKTTDSSGATEFDGLKEGTYYLLETKAPDGYNLLKDPVTIVITVEEKEENAITEEKPESYTISATADGEEAAVAHTEDNEITAGKDNDVTIQVANSQGTELPSTGGIGTTIFYIVGGLLAVGAGVVLVTKKRMGKVDD